MKTKEINVGTVLGLNSYQLAVKTGKFSGTLEEYIAKEQETYNQMVQYADMIKADMESLLASVSDGSAKMSEVINARSTYKTLGERLNATDEEIEIILDRLNEVTEGAEKISVTGMDKNIEMRNNGVYIQWKYAGYTKWNNLIAVSDMTPKFSVGEVKTVDASNDASVKLSGTKNQPVLNFDIPQGKDGVDGGSIINIYRNADGDVIARIRNNSVDEELGEDGNVKYITPVFQIGEVETLPHTAKAYATITGTPSNPILNLGIPRGEPTMIKRGRIGDDGLLIFETE